MSVQEFPKSVGEQEAKTKAASILVVDDHESNRDVLTRRLERHQYQVKTASGGAEALQMIESEPFDLVLLDVMMPGVSGLDVLRQVRLTRTPLDLPIIMATAKDQSQDVVQALTMGANDYVTKPLDFTILLARVETQLLVKNAMGEVKALQEHLRERNVALEEANAELLDAQDRMRRDLETAARLQKAQLPTAVRKTSKLSFAWHYNPCEQLAGDFLNICPLDEEHVALYVLDVSGHGVAASLLAMAAARSLSITNDADSLLTHTDATTGLPEPSPPCQVADRLNQKFAWDDSTEQFLTIFYALVNPKKREVIYTSAGHPGAVLLNPGSAPSVLDRGGLPISLGIQYEQYTAPLVPGARVYLYTDGVTEAMNPRGEMFGFPRLLEAVKKFESISLTESVKQLVSEIDHWRDSAPVRDDVSILAFELMA